MKATQEAPTMTEIHLGQAAGLRRADGQAAKAGSGRGRQHRIGARLWALLHAPALLTGAASGPHDPGYVEDDRQRLAARPER
jgi:hypothetical protein